jgi:hypothetical protein
MITLLFDLVVSCLGLTIPTLTLSPLLTLGAHATISFSKLAGISMGTDQSGQAKTYRKR